MTANRTVPLVASVVSATALVAAGCGAHGKASVQGATFATTVTATTGSNAAACRQLRGTAKTTNAEVAGAVGRFASVRSRTQLLAQLGTLRMRFQAAAAKTGPVQVSSAPLMHDRSELVSGLNLLAQQVAQARSAVASGNLAAAARLSGGAALQQLTAASGDLSHRCGHVG